MRPGGRMLLLTTEDNFSGAWTSRFWCCRTYNRQSCSAPATSWAWSGRKSSGSPACTSCFAPAASASRSKSGRAFAEPESAQPVTRWPPIQVCTTRVPGLNNRACGSSRVSSSFNEITARSARLPASSVPRSRKADRLCAGRRAQGQHFSRADGRMVCGDKPHLFQQVQVGIRGSAVSAQRHGDVCLEQICQRIGGVAEVVVRARAVDERHRVGMFGQGDELSRGQIVAMDHERPRCRGQALQIVACAGSRAPGSSSHAFKSASNWRNGPPPDSSSSISSTDSARCMATGSSNCWLMRISPSNRREWTV